MKAIVRWALELDPCPCGCNFVRVRGEIQDFSELGRLAKWACRDGNSD